MRRFRFDRIEYVIIRFLAAFLLLITALRLLKHEILSLIQ